VKARARDFVRLYEWLTHADLLIIKCDRREPPAVCRLGLATMVATAAEKSRAAP
jgi:hypothetical protein